MTVALDQAERRGDFPPVLPLGEWALSPDIVHLNHGAFGGVPLALRAEQDGWRQRMDGNPSRFFMDELFDLLTAAAEPIARLVGTAPDRLAFVENASSGIATVLASLSFGTGDRIVTTSHVYGAVRNMLAEIARREDVEIVEVPLACPVAGEDEVLSCFRAAIEPGAHLVAVDHVTSASALILPIAGIVKLCRERGIPVLIDGSHAPGMLDLDVDEIGADWYVGNCHKWLCAPRGAAFVVAARHARPCLRPLVLSHAYGMGFPAEFRKVGTRDPSAILSIPAAIRLHEALGGESLRRRNRQLAQAAAQIIGGRPSGPAGMRGAMVALTVEGLPATPEAAKALRLNLRQAHGIEALAVALADCLWLRLSAHAYNSLADFEELAVALPQAVDALAGGAS